MREKEGEGEREREKERQPAILAAILNPSPCSPRHTTCLDVGRQSQAPGPAEARRKGALPQHWDGRTPTQLLWLGVGGPGRYSELRAG